MNVARKLRYFGHIMRKEDENLGEMHHHMKALVV